MKLVYGLDHFYGLRTRKPPSLSASIVDSKQLRESKSLRCTKHTMRNILKNSCKKLKSHFGNLLQPLPETFFCNENASRDNFLNCTRRRLVLL